MHFVSKYILISHRHLSSLLNAKKNPKVGPGLTFRCLHCALAVTAEKSLPPSRGDHTPLWGMDLPVKSCFLQKKETSVLLQQ